MTHSLSWGTYDWVAGLKLAVKCKHEFVQKKRGVHKGADLVKSVDERVQIAQIVRDRADGRVRLLEALLKHIDNS